MLRLSRVVCVHIPVALVKAYRKCVTRAYVNGLQRVALLAGGFIRAGINIRFCNAG